MTFTLHRRRGCYAAWRLLVIWLALGTLAPLTSPPLAHAHGAPQRRPGRVLIIRGALTVFSLGLDTLGDELEAQGMAVEVVPAYSAASAAQEIAEAHKRRPQPIVIIGHSKGGHLAPQCAEQLAKSRIPVALVVVVDNPNAAIVPANVERCVNFYQTNWLGVVQGALMKAQSAKTEIWNVNIDKLPQRGRGGYIDHFNIDASPWVHSMIVQQVLRACPAETPTASDEIDFNGAHRLVRPSPMALHAPPATRPAMHPAPRPMSAQVPRSPSPAAIRYPTVISR